jgi:cytochrome c1
MVPNTRDQLRNWLTDPQQTKSGCLMPAFGLNAQQVDLLVSYLMTLK